MAITMPRNLDISGILLSTRVVVCHSSITLGLSRAWKPERRRSVGCKASAPGRCSARDLARTWASPQPHGSGTPLLCGLAGVYPTPVGHSGSDTGLHSLPSACTPEGLASVLPTSLALERCSSYA